MKKKSCFMLALLLITWIVPTAWADVITEPSGLNPGDQYRIMFVSSTSRDGHGYVADYDAFVTAAANGSPELAALATTWTAVVSTQEADGSFINANQHTDTDHPYMPGVPFAVQGILNIYNTIGEIRANTVGPLYGSSVSNLWESGPNHFTFIAHDEFGNLVATDTSVWTGSSEHGNAANPLGGNPNSLGEYGSVGSFYYDIDRGSFSKGNQARVYGISGVLTIPVPEPSSLGLLAIFGFALLGRRR